MATTNVLDASGPVYEKGGLLSNAVKDAAHGSSSESAAADIKYRVQCVWEEMNKGVSLKPISNSHSSTMNTTSEKRSNNWMRYLGLAPRQETEEKVSGVIENCTSDVAKGVAAMWKEMNKGARKRTLKPFSDKPSPTVDAKTSEKMPDNWKTYLGIEPKKTGSLEQDAMQNEPLVLQNHTSDEAKKLAAAALSAVKDAAAAAMGKGKIELKEVRDFAGQEIEFKKLVDADSKEASEKAKAPAASAVDVVLEQIKKKPKLSVLDKTKKDWGEFKEENKGLEEELDAYKKSSNQYLEKVSFLQRTDYREFERERDVRLALQARRKPDMREEP